MKTLSPSPCRIIPRSSPVRPFTVSLVLGIIRFASLLAGCDSTPQEPQAPPDVQQATDAAKSLLESLAPGGKVIGTTASELQDASAQSLFVIGIHRQDGGRERVTNLLVRKFVKPDGGEYWRAERLTPATAQMVGALFVQQQLANAADAEYDYDPPEQEF